MNVTAPAPTVQLEFTVEPHPDPVVQSLIEKVERLQAENREMRAQLMLTQPIGGSQWP
jgi:hypothetical protein